MHLPLTLIIHRVLEFVYHSIELHSWYAGYLSNLLDCERCLNNTSTTDHLDRSDLTLFQMLNDMCRCIIRSQNGRLL